ncbi:BolA-like protein 1 [Balamuthia mandrillaris]
MEGTQRGGPIQQRIEEKLRTHLHPLAHCEVVNESDRHCVPKNSETHFKVLLVSERFEGLSLLERHRLVNQALVEELQGGVHALSINAKTPTQWEKLQEKKIHDTPACLGGIRK